VSAQPVERKLRAASIQSKRARSKPQRGRPIGSQTSMSTRSPKVTGMLGTHQLSTTTSNHPALTGRVLQRVGWCLFDVNGVDAQATERGRVFEPDWSIHGNDPLVSQAREIGDMLGLNSFIIRRIRPGRAPANRGERWTGAGISWFTHRMLALCS
jgi:hypothetical protein